MGFLGHYLVPCVDKSSLSDLYLLTPCEHVVYSSTHAIVLIIHRYCYLDWFKLVSAPKALGQPRALGIQVLFLTILQWFISKSWTPIFPLMYSGLVFLPIISTFFIIVNLPLVLNM